MNREELLKEIDSIANKMKEELIEGKIHGCLIWIREGKTTEIQTY